MLLGPYSKVKIIGVINPEQVCLHIHEEDGILERILHAINVIRPDDKEVHPLLEEEIYPGKAVLYRDDDNTHYRATIIKNLGTDILVWLGDYGQETLTKQDELYTAPHWTFEIAYQAVIVGIRGIEPIRKRYSEKHKEIVREFVKDEIWTLELDVEETGMDAIWGRLFLETEDPENHLDYSVIMRGFGACRKSNNQAPFKFQAPGPLFCSVYEHVEKFTNFSHEDIQYSTPTSSEDVHSDVGEEENEQIVEMDIAPTDISIADREFLTTWEVIEAPIPEEEEDSDGYESNASC